MTIGQFVLWGKEKLKSRPLQCADPVLHMKQIVEAALGLDTVKLYLRWEDLLSESEHKKLQDFFSRRLAGEPFQYITGREGFWNFEFDVGPGVLIPRRETEVLVECVLRENTEKLKIAELGAGTGAIGITVLNERSKWEWHAFELNPKSIPYLESNKARLLPADASFFIHAKDFFEGAPLFAPYDAIVTNPPYLSDQEMRELSLEVQHEPPLALAGGKTGTELFSRLVTAASSLLRPRGILLSEIGWKQSEVARNLFEMAGFVDVHLTADYAGLPRVVSARKGE